MGEVGGYNGKKNLKCSHDSGHFKSLLELLTTALSLSLSLSV